MPQSPPLYPVNPSPCSQQQPLSWDGSRIPKLQDPAPEPSRVGVPVQGMYGCGKDCLILIPFRLSQISCVTFSFKCFSSDSANCPDVGIWPLLQFPDLLRAGPFPLTLLFFPLVPLNPTSLHGSIYSFPLVKYSCLLSVGVLHVLLCLKVYSWCIHGERSTSAYSSAILFSSKPVFYSPISTSSRDSLVRLLFLPLEWYNLHIWDCWYFSLHSEIQE